MYIFGPYVEQWLTFTSGVTGNRNLFGRREVGGLKFGEAGVLDLNKLHTEWYDWVMNNGKKPEFLKYQSMLELPVAK